MEILSSFIPQMPFKRPRNFASPAFGARFKRCGGRVCALDRTKCQAGGWLAFGPRKCGWLHALTPHVCAETPLVCVRAHLWGGRSAHSTMFRVGITVLHEGHPDRKYVVIARNGEHVTCREVGTRKECVCGSSLLTPVDTWVWTPDSQAFFKRVDKGTPKYCQGCRI